MFTVNIKIYTILYKYVLLESVFLNNPMQITIFAFINIQCWLPSNYLCSREAFLFFKQRNQLNEMMERDKRERKRLSYQTFNSCTLTKCKIEKKRRKKLFWQFLSLSPILSRDLTLQFINTGKRNQNKEYQYLQMRGRTELHRNLQTVSLTTNLPKITNFNQLNISKSYPKNPFQIISFKIISFLNIQ